MRQGRPATLRTRLLAGLLLVVIVVIVIFDVATVIALRDSQVRRVDGILNRIVTSHQERAAELVAAAERRQRPPPVMPDVVPNDYYVEVATNDRGIVALVVSPDGMPALPADLTDMARSGEIRTVTGVAGAFRLRAVPTDVGILVAAVNMGSAMDAVHTAQVILAVATVIAVAMVALGGLMAVRFGLRPLDAMAAQADRITAGELTRPVAPQTPDTEVGRLGLALNRMLGRIHASVQEQQAGQERMRRFLADASHELRTPLTSMRANAELYEQGALTTRAEVDEVMRRIRVSAQRMGTLVDDMLQLARLDQHPEQRTGTVDLSALLTDAVSDARSIDADRTCVGEIQPDLIVHGDPDLLRSAVDNLLANIREHTPAGTNGTVTAHRRGDQVHVEVRDDGPGVPEAELPHLFDRFYRVDHTTSGSGLGLAIVAEVTASHGGHATATATTPHGLRIRLGLPTGTVPTSSPIEVETETADDHPRGSVVGR
jgi:two-component system OmpR family sensor kinase